ncbi:MAG: phage regulatory CII family protein [Burkholderiales bacterium]
MAKVTDLPKDVQRAFRDTCFAFGVPELAALMAMKPGVLYNKCELEEHHHKPTLQDLLLVQVATGDKRITHAMAQLMGGVFVDLSSLKGSSDEAILDLVSEWMKEQGELFARWQEAYGDGHISPADFKRIRKEAFDVLGAVLAFVSRVEGMQQ